MTKQPLALTNEDFKELAAHPGLYPMWGATNAEEMEAILRQSYAVKFDFVSGCPGYVGDLFIIHGDALDGDMPPVRLYRNIEDKLEIVH